MDIEGKCFCGVTFEQRPEEAMFEREMWQGSQP
jgi:hypothetical protein